jgi:hypothetical protein
LGIQRTAEHIDHHPLEAGRIERALSQATEDHQEIPNDECRPLEILLASGRAGGPDLECLLRSGCAHQVIGLSDTRGLQRLLKQLFAAP